MKLLVERAQKRNWLMSFGTNRRRLGPKKRHFSKFIETGCIFFFYSVMENIQIWNRYKKIVRNTFQRLFLFLVRSTVHTELPPIGTYIHNVL